VQGVHFDGRTYYRKKPHTEANEWLEDSTEVVKRHLEVNFGLSSRSINGNPSEVKQALSHIETHQRIAGQMPRLYSDQPIFRRDNKVYLNNNTCFACEMADEPQTWGTNFPLSAKWLDAILAMEDQRKYLDAWIHYAYKPSKDGKPIKLPTLFLVGGVGIGKTLFSNCLLSGLLGGHTDATKYFLGQETTNENLVTHGLATVDDQENTSSRSQKNTFSAILKKITANHNISYRKMYKGPVDTIWMGKTIVTCNLDAKSMESIPNMDLSNMDKLLILRCVEDRKTWGWDFPADVEEQLLAERPYFARYYYDLTPDPDAIGSNRFTVKPFIDPKIFEHAEASSDSAIIEEIILKWRDNFFKNEHKESYWDGSAIDVVSELERFYAGEAGSGKAIMKDIGPRSIQNHFKDFSSKGYKWLEQLEKKTNRRMCYRIHRDK